MVYSTIRDEREALAAALRTIADLNVYAYWPDNMQLPAALVRPSSRREIVMGDYPNRTYEIEVLTLNSDQESAQRVLDDFLEEEGSASIREALEADLTLGDVVDGLSYEGWADYGGRRTEAAAFIGAIVTVVLYPRDS